jgi:hypothetical protein
MLFASRNASSSLFQRDRSQYAHGYPHARSARTNVHPAATSDLFGSLIDMRRIARVVVLILALAPLLVPGGANAAHGRRALPAKCAPSLHTLLADSQAQVYGTPKDIDGVISLRACVYGQRRSFIVSGCNYEESPAACVESSHVTLAGTFVATEGAFVPECRCAAEDNIAEWHVVVQSLRTGKVLYEVPTGVPLKPKPRYVGVGQIVALVLKSDGSVAWIAEDYERSSKLYGDGAPYFDVYATDKTGTRLLASGTNIDPSSLALSVGDFGVSGVLRTVVGSALYWTQGGKSESAPLD